MINKILIRASDRKILHKDTRTIGMSGENLQEVLLFILDKKIEGTGIVEVELPNGEKGMIEVSSTEEGYELPVKSSLLSQTGFVKFQLRILHDDVEIFKSEILPLEVKESINATAAIPEQYPTWIDILQNLKKDLENAENERNANEKSRQLAEESRQEKFTEIQKEVSDAVEKIVDLEDDYNENAKKQTEDFNNNVSKKSKEFNDNYDTKTSEFNNNASNKLDDYNKNDTDKVKLYNDNASKKLDDFNRNANSKLEEYDNNTLTKIKEYDINTEDKIREYNSNAQKKTEEFNQNAESLKNRIAELENQIPSRNSKRK